MLGIEWNGTLGHNGTAPYEGTPGETSTAALAGQLNKVSAVDELGTKILYLMLPVRLHLEAGDYVNEHGSSWFVL
jgi:hypothetical protein